jgi:hypothetical protein
MALTDIETIEEYTGTTLDSAETVVYQAVIDAVDAWIECYCDTKFDDDVYIERVNYSDGRVTVRNHPRQIYGMFYGANEVITVTNTSATASISILTEDLLSGDSASVTNQKILRLISAFTTTDIDITSSTLSSVAALINAEGGWTASYTGDFNTYSATLYEGDFQTDDDGVVKLLAASDKVSVSKLSNRVFQSNVTCTEGIAIYQGGYVTVPADLKDAATRFSIKAYNDRNVTTSGDLKSEKVGDYSYTVMTAAEASGGLEGLSIEYRSVLDCYRSYDI